MATRQFFFMLFIIFAHNCSIFCDDGHCDKKSEICKIEPKYFKTIEKDLTPFPKITLEMLDKARKAASHPVTYQILKGQVFRTPDCLFPSRCDGIDHFLNKLASDLPDVEMVINTHDWPFVNKHFYKDGAIPLFSFSKTDKFYDVMFPAWTFWAGGPAIGQFPRGLGRWDLMRSQLLKSKEDWPWDKKKAVAFFRGSRTSDERDDLIFLSKSRPDLFDAKYTKNQAWRSKADTLGFEPAPEVTLEDHCKYKYLFNFRGVAASFRFKHLFLCGSAVLHVGHEWLEFFYPGLEPWKHYVPVRHGASQEELVDVVKNLERNPSLAKEIARNGFEYIRDHLTLNDVEAYWLKLVKTYADRMTFKPDHNPDYVKVKPKI